MEVMAEFKRAAIGLVPLDWTISALSELCDVRDGTHESPNFYPDGVPFVTSKNIVNGKIDLENVSYIRKEDAVEFNKRSKVDQGDILMSMIGTIGMAALVDTIPDFCIKNVALLKPKKISPDYLLQLLDSPPFQKYLAESLDGGIQKFISLSTLRSLEITFPNSTEQSAIATALSDVDALIAGLEKLIAKKRDLKQAAMQQLLTGQTRLPRFSGDWAIKPMCDVAQIQKGQLITTETIVSGDVPVIAGGKKPAYFHNKPNRLGKTITVSASGASAGYVAFHRSPIFASDCSTISEAKTYCIEFVFFAMQLKQDEIYNAQTGGAQPHIQPKDLAPLMVPFPTNLREQEAIASVLCDMDDELISLESRLSKTRDLKQGMMQELLTGHTRLV